MSEDLVDWCDVMAVAMVARDWFTEFSDSDAANPVAALLHTGVGGKPVSDSYIGNITRIAAALRSAYAAGQRDGGLEVARLLGAAREAEEEDR